MTGKKGILRLIWFWTLLCFCVSASLSAQTVRLSGVVKAAPHPGVKKTATGGGGYSKKALADAVAFDYDHPKNVVVYAERADQSEPPSSTPNGAITIKENYRGFTLSPDFLVVATGKDFTIESDAKESLTLYASGRSPSSFSVTVEPKTKQKYRLDAGGLYWIGVWEDDTISSKIFAAGPYFTVADNSGKYFLDLPPGSYRVTAWQERLPSQTQEVQLAEGKPQKCDFLLTVKGLPEVQ
jgi:hypothetical protein